MISPTDVQQLYKQWQDGKLLDTEERNALRPKSCPDAYEAAFADFLKNGSEAHPAS